MDGLGYLARMVGFGNVPIGSRRDYTQQSETGQPVYQDAAGNTVNIGFGEQRQRMSPQLFEQLQGPQVYGRPEDRAVVNWTPDAARMSEMLRGAPGGIARAMTEGLTAPGRAAQGEPVTYGDTWATALDYGIMGAPMNAPRGALRSGAMRRLPRNENGQIVIDSIPPRRWADRYAVDFEPGQIVQRNASRGLTPSEAQRELLAKVSEKITPDYGPGFFRMTNNRQELNLARSGRLRPSRNYVDGIDEAGLSVADGPHYLIEPYQYAYRVDGPVLGYGSDGEPLLDVSRLNVLSDLQPADEMRKWARSLEASSRAELIHDDDWADLLARRFVFNETE